MKVRHFLSVFGLLAVVVAVLYILCAPLINWLIGYVPVYLSYNVATIAGVTVRPWWALVPIAIWLAMLLKHESAVQDGYYP